LRQGGPRAGSLAALKGPKSQRLGAEAGSVADYNLRQRGYLRRLFRNQLAVLKALHDGDIDYAYLWANVGWTLHATPEFRLEPVLQRVETSQHAYGGLSQVRSAGVLVVGLDQNNLPLSTAHPWPAGLDYEVAGLLAEQLGVSLHVYWAYSAHDSYPSKLATK